MKAKKRLGQNYLIDEVIRDKIIEAAEISASDTILEVGPGLGMLTEKLAESAGRVIAVEVDEGLVDRLGRKFSKMSNLVIIHADILKVDLQNALGGETSYKVVANIPYYITSPILSYFTQADFKPSLMVIMMQQEVADDVTSSPGHLSFLSVSMQLFSRPSVVCKVPASSFNPQPNVNSTVVKFEMLKEPVVPIDNIKLFLEFLHSGFKAPRKQLHNSLAIGLKMEPGYVDDLLVKSGIDPQKRPGNLTLIEWFELYRNMGAGRC